MKYNFQSRSYIGLENRAIKLIIIVFLTMVFTAFLAIIFKTDRVYTHFFYLPLALSAIWQIKKTTWLGAFFGIYHLILEWLVVGQIQITISIRAGIIVIIACLLQLICNRDENYQQEIHHLSYENAHDALAGAYNRKQLDLFLSMGFSYPLCIMIADLDGLKRVNDNLGHLAGDNFIKNAADVLHRSLRTGDILARIGGDEFCIVAQNCTEEGAIEILQRIDYQIKLLNQEKDLGSSLSISVGFAICNENEEIKKTFETADQKMYEAKKRKYEVLNESV